MNRRQFKKTTKKAIKVLHKYGEHHTEGRSLHPFLMVQDLFNDRVQQVSSVVIQDKYSFTMAFSKVKTNHLSLCNKVNFMCRILNK